VREDQGRLLRHVEALLNVIAAMLPAALNVLDRFHIAKNSLKPSMKCDARKSASSPPKAMNRFSKTPATAF
jgi:hypothetical protein